MTLTKVVGYASVVKKKSPSLASTVWFRPSLLIFNFDIPLALGDSFMYVKISQYKKDPVGFEPTTQEIINLESVDIPIRPRGICYKPCSFL